MAGSTVVIDKGVTIGRRSMCEICYPSHLFTVSRHHAHIFPIGEGWAIEDLNSCNGTFVNGKPIKEPVLLESGSKIMLGQGGPELLFIVETSEPLEIVGSNSSASGQSSPLSPTVLFPFFSLHQEVWRSGYLLPANITVICAALIALANHEKNVSFAELTFSLLNCTLSCLAFYELCNRRKPLQFTLLIMLMMAVAAYGLISLHQLTCSLKGQALWCNDAFTSIIGEEFLTSLPLLVCLFLGGWLPRLWHKRLQIEEPLDGILIAGAAVTGLSLAHALSISLKLRGFNLDLFSTLLGLGPIAYSSLLGYCTGLFATCKLAQRRQKLALLFYGYAGAFGLKAVKYGIDSLPDFGLWTLLTMGLTVGYALFCAYVLYAYVFRAKKLSERLNNS